MTSSEVDYYDVQRMIEDEASRLRGRMDDLVRELQLTLERELRELRSEIADSLINGGTLA